MFVATCLRTQNSRRIFSLLRSSALRATVPEDFGTHATKLRLSTGKTHLVGESADDSSSAAVSKTLLTAASIRVRRLAALATGFLANGRGVLDGADTG